MIEKSIDEVVNDFNPSDKHERTTLNKHITVWVTEETKAKYDRIQSACSHRFTRVVRQAIELTVDKAAAKLP